MFITRPATAFLILVAFGYLFYRDRKQMIEAAVPSALGLLLFRVYSSFNRGGILPPYYLTPTAPPPPFFKAYYWLLMSPSRGLLVFSPWIALTIGLIIALRRTLLRQPLVIMSIFWGVMLLALLARTSFWFGGSSYGPRLQGDILPGVVLSTFFAWHALKESGWSGKIRYSVVAVFIVLGLFSGFVHTRQGLFNSFHHVWSAQPYMKSKDPARNAQALNDWQYPQFLVSKKNIEGLVNKYLEETNRGKQKVTVVSYVEPGLDRLIRDTIWAYSRKSF